MLSASREAGFTLVEVVVALVILSTAVLGLASSAAQLTTAAASAEIRALAQVAVDDRLARVRLDPRYASLDSLYAGAESDLFEVPGLRRTTTVTRITQDEGRPVDYTLVTIVVTGPSITSPISRRIVVAAP